MVLSKKNSFILSAFALAVSLVTATVTHSPAAYAATVCTGVANQATVCLDPTTGYGVPVIFVFSSSNSSTAVWTSTITSACSQGTYTKSPKADGDVAVNYGPSTAHIVFTSTTQGTCSGTNLGWGYMSQSTLDAFRWVSNYYGTNTGKVVQ
jgi:hypothetical protein